MRRSLLSVPNLLSAISVEEEQQKILAEYCEVYRAAGYERAAFELTAGLSTVRGHPWQAAQPTALAALFAHEVPWQRVIAALESLAGDAGAARWRAKKRASSVAKTQSRI